MGPPARVSRRHSLQILFVAVALLSGLPRVVPPALAADAPPAQASLPPPDPVVSSDPDPKSESPRYRLDPIVVTPDRFPLALNRIPSDVTVITEERLQRERSFFLADALSSAPGIDVQRSGALGKLTDVRLRGADPRHTLVLFDGIPLNGP